MQDKLSSVRRFLCALSYLAYYPLQLAALRYEAEDPDPDPPADSLRSILRDGLRSYEARKSSLPREAQDASDPLSVTADSGCGIRIEWAWSNLSSTSFKALCKAAVIALALSIHAECP